MKSTANHQRVFCPAMAIAMFLPAMLARAEAESPLSTDAPMPSRVSFNDHIRPIFAGHCVACHGGVKQASGVSFVYREKALIEGDSGVPAIVPGDVDESYLVERISDPDPDYRMPPAEHGPALSTREIELVKQWIAEGANWEGHWSFVPTRRHDAPTTIATDWSRTAVDPFVLARLEFAGLAPSPEATKNEWLRRVKFDLVGLPPTAEERVAFLADDSPEAYERVVDRLLESPHFGERWAAMWLDLVRYSDTMGYEKDPHRDIWPYRDWLIRALNDDLPYDQLIVKQLAGDLLPGGTLADRVATAMHRNTQTNTEGGTDDEEFRTAAVVDRITTTWQVFGGLTFGCVQCHSHPYDPIEHEEFYRFLAVFNSTRDYDLDEETPRLAVPKNLDDWQKADDLDRQISKLKRAIHFKLLPLAQDQGAWKPLAIDQARSTGETQLTIRNSPDDGASEFITEGTVTARSTYTITGPTPNGLTQLTALRIDSLPKDLQAALRTPETGFAVTRLVATLRLPDVAEPQPLYFRLAMCDEPEPILEPQDCLQDNNRGWAMFPRIDRPRWAVFALDESVDLPPGSRIEVVMKHNRAASGEIATVIDRGRIALSDDPRWIAAVNSAELQQMQDDLTVAKKARDEIASVSMPVMSELDPEDFRKTFVFERGNWLNKGDEVTPGVPAAFPSIDSDGPINRLDVAEWFTSAGHPLTARVMVNRTWEQLFGLGIVETMGDFGTSGQAPSHLELLDDLATRFATDMQWSFKTLLREVVLSATYRQQSHATPELLELDPRNRLLARGPRQRLTAEMVRDQALVLSGKFSDKMYGPSVMPPQPEGVWRSVYSGARWKTAKGDDRYRRAVYTYWKRTSPYPAMMTFDAPSREVCSVQRIATNTPLQPLVTMNDPVFVECAQGFAERMQDEGGDEVAKQVVWALELATSDYPRPAAVAALVALYNDASARFDANDTDMAALGSTVEHYARTIVASAILNLDDVITR